MYVQSRFFSGESTLENSIFISISELRLKQTDVEPELASRGGPIRPEGGASVSRRAYLSRGLPILPKAGLSVQRRAYLFRGGPICPEAGLSIPRRAYLFRGGPIYPEAGPSIPRHTHLSRGAYPSRDGPSPDNQTLNLHLEVAGVCPRSLLRVRGSEFRD